MGPPHLRSRGDRILLLLTSFLYHTALQVYRAAIGLASFRNKKAREWIKGRKNLFQGLESTLQGVDRPIVWFHCSSRGEFEQGRPLIKKWKEAEPDHYILLTFFSPSGFASKEAHKEADAVFYLPLDGPRNAYRFISLVSPAKAVFIKYEYWYYYLRALYEKQVPTYLVSAHFRKDQPFFKWYGGWFRKWLHYYRHIFVQTEEAGRLLDNVGVRSWSLAGDTRIDRVAGISSDDSKIPGIEEFTRGKITVIAGSTWPPDESLLVECLTEFPQVQWILAPHEVAPHHLEDLQRKIGEWGIRYSQMEAGHHEKHQVLIMDSVGLLNHLYQYGDIAYIGGGFGKGIHNTLEPAAYSLPILFGPRYHLFPEAVSLVRDKGAFSVSTATETRNILKSLIENEDQRKKAGKQARNYIERNKGATDKIFQQIRSHPLD